MAALASLKMPQLLLNHPSSVLLWILTETASVPVETGEAFWVPGPLTPDAGASSGLGY